LTELSDETRAQYRIPEDVNGVLVLSVQRRGLAAKNELRRGDVIEQFNRKEVTKPSEVTSALKAALKSDRESVPVLIRRGRSSGYVPFELK